MTDTVLYPPREMWEGLCKRPLMEMNNIDRPVKAILDSVRKNGDLAVKSFSKEFDKVDINALKVSDEEIQMASSLVPAKLKSAIGLAIENVRKFHEAQSCTEDPVETVPGVRCWRKRIPFESVGLYIPGGSAPLFSTVIMLAIPAAIAGCKRIIMCTPPSPDGSVNPVILYTASVTGVKEIFRAGGAQAIGAMAYGTESIPSVSKIFGPGNQYVTKAKEIVSSQGVAIDMPAGPSEVLVIADKTANPAFVASDLLSQAEHGPDSQVVLVTPDSQLAEKVKSEIDLQLNHLPRKNIALHSLMNSLFVILSDINECIEFSNTYAPEHLIINASDAISLSEAVTNAGSVFIGPYSCESAGDYASGTNHTLPTNGFAKIYSGLSVESYFKTISYQQIDPQGLKKIGPAIEEMASAEQLEGHRNAVSIRLKQM